MCDTYIVTPLFFYFDRESDVDKIAGHIDKLIESVDLDLPSLCWLIYLLSCYPSCDYKILVNRVILWSLGRIREQLSEDKKIVIIIPLVRFLGNVCASNDENILALLNEADFAQVVNQLLNSSYEPICKETLLLVANIVNNPSPQIQSTLVILNFKEFWGKSVNNVIALF